MSKYFDKIKELALAAGHSIDPVHNLSISLLEQDIAGLSVGIKNKRDLIEVLDQQLKSSQLALQLERELDQNFGSDVDKDISDIHTKIEILKSYMITLDGGEDFVITKISNEINDHNKTTYDVLKCINNKASDMKDDIERMRALQRQCDDLRKRVTAD